MTNSIQNLFAQVPHTYERINHLLTFGLDIRWRKRAVQQAVKQGGTLWMDVCSGTGETAAALADAAPEGTTVMAADFSLPMLREIDNKPQAQRIIRMGANVRQLPLPDNCVDLITISFATRNINLSRSVLTETFAEFHRVLKPGGLFVNVETSQPSNRLLRWGAHRYIKLAVKPVGALISGSTSPYVYLSHTIPRFYDAGTLKDILLEAGFSTVEFQKRLGGVAAIHFSRK